MKNKKAVRAAGIFSFVFLSLLLIMGLKTMSKYANSIKDWHYIGALIGSIGIGCLMLASIVGLILTFKRNDKNS
jgi:tellurite resistance protein TehA-like permease